MSAATWGAPGGISQAIGDMNTLATTAYTQGKTAMLPTEQEHMQAQTSLIKGQASKIPSEIMNLWAQSAEHTANAGLKNQALEQTKRMSEAMQKMSMGDMSGDPLDFAIRSSGEMLKASIQSGAVDSMNKIAGEYSSMLGHRAAMDRNNLMAQHQEHQNRLDKINAVGMMLNGVSDQQSLNDAAAQYQSTFKEPAPFAGKMFSPELIQGMQEKTLSYKDKLNNEFKLDRQDSIDKYRELRDNVARIGMDLRERQVADRERRTIDAEKNGGKVTSEPSKEQVSSIRTLAEKDGFKGAAVDDFASSVAFDAKSMRMKNGAISPEQANYLAYQNRKKELETTDTFFGGKKTVFNSSKIGTWEAPMSTLPSDPKEWKTGKVYPTGKGGFAEYLGGDKWKVPDGAQQ